MKNKLAIFSPSFNAYSETFIQAHRRLNNGNVAFYNGAINDLKLNDSISVNSKVLKIPFRLFGILIRESLFDVKYNLLKSLRKNNVSIALIEYGNFAAELLPILEYCKIPFIVHFHGYDASLHSCLNKYQDQYKVLFIKASYVIAVSRVMELKLLELGCPKEKIIYNVYGPNDMFFNIKPNFLTNNLIAIGRFVEKKAPHNLIKVFSNVLKTIPNAYLTIVGDGHLLDSSKDLAAKLKIIDKINFVVKATPDNIVSFLENSSCFIQHSVVAPDGDTEGTPLSILEASASGLPIVSTFHAGIQDVVINGETGFLVKEHDIDEMSNKIIEILSNKNLASRFGTEGKSRINNYFKLSMHLDKLDELFNLIENKNQSTI